MNVPLLAAAVLFLDQLTKLLVVKYLPLHETIPLLPFFALTHVQNTGAAFGIYADGNMFFIIMTVLVLTVLVILHKKIGQSGMLARRALGLLWGGAVGNLLDRIFRGAVTDFLDFFVGNWHWPAFNVADSAICIAVFTMFVEGFFIKHRAETTTSTLPDK